VLWTVVLAPIGGCGKDGLHDVSGKVTFKGKPVPAGWVNFTPDSTKGNNGPQGRARITDGTYNTAGADGKGTVGGPMTVQIQGLDGKGQDAKPIFAPYEMTLDLPKERTTKDLQIPDEWAKRRILAPPP
jgi:hypothetical protein